MRTPVFQLQDLQNAFRQKKVLTKEELLQATQCSAMTAWRLLQRQGYYTSYNGNARYYTLAGIPQFDQHGLWNLRKIRFSKWGSLTETIIGLIENSQAGMTPEQLQQLLHVKNVRPALARLVQQERLARKKMCGRFVYFSMENFSHQQQCRRQMESALALPPAEKIIALLVEIIQRPQNSPRQWATRLARQQIRLSTNDIRAVLNHYELDGKKGLFTFLNVRGQLVRQFAGRLPTVCQLPDGYSLEFISPRDTCPDCYHPLRRVRTSIYQPVGLMLGRPRARRVQKGCIHCGWTDSLDGYHELVPPGCNYAFDLIVEVGLARLRDLKQDVEIRNQLQLRWGITLPLSAIGLLANSFLDGLGAAHQACIPALRHHLEQDGGYAMHVDGTCEPGTDVVFAALAAPRSWTLGVAKMTTENVGEISKLLRCSVEDFGPPLAVMRDLSKNIQKAKEAVIPCVPDLICHYHFLENVGAKLCEKPHAKLTRELRRLKVRPPLARLRRDMVLWSRRGNSPLSPAQVEELLSHSERAVELELVTSRRLVAYVLLRWLDDYGSDLRGEYFPFDLPSLAFYHRGCQLGEWLKAVMSAGDFPREEFSTLATMLRHLTVLQEDPEVVAAAMRLAKAAALFGELREVLRLNSASEHLLRGRGPNETREQVERVPERLENWRKGLQRQLSGESDADKRSDQTVVLNYLETYERQLVGHVIPLEGRSEPLVVSRTNNLSEHRFGSTKRDLRRKVGAKKLTRYIQAMRAEVLLLPNLDDAVYVDIVFGGSLDNLAVTFSEHWSKGADDPPPPSTAQD